MGSLKFGFQLFLVFAGVQYFSSIFYPACGSAEKVTREEEQASDGLEMIAARMQELSRSLDKMPEPPVMNQTIEIPNWSNNTSQKKRRPLKVLKNKFTLQEKEKK